LLSSALPEAHILMEVEREGKIAVRRWFTLKDGQQLIELPVLEADRGGFTVHFIGAERGLSHKEDVFIEVPWSNKELKLEWMTFRDKLLPGAKEEWRLKITGPAGEQVAAQLLAGMYDASLDHYVRNDWNMSVWPTASAQLGWEQMAPFGTNGSITYGRQQSLPNDTVHIYPALNLFGLPMAYGRGGVMTMEMRAMSADAAMAPPMQANAGFAEKDMEDSSANAEVPEPVTAQDVPQPATRTDFRETAFFFPDLLTDKDGSVILKFTMPDALTRWKLLGLAHTTDLKTARFTKEVITQKPLMVTPNLPRFLREGDRITLTSKVNVVDAGVSSRSAGVHAGVQAGSREADPAAAPLQGTATLELFDPFTNAAINSAFNLQQNTRPFTAGPGASAVVAWDLTVPEGLSAVAVRISAKAGSFTDAEQRPLPILTDRVLVTESLPLPISTAGKKTFTLEKLRNDTSSTLRHQSLKLEFTPNPAWYAVQALPYLMEYPHQCSEQVFSRLYANSLAAHIVDEKPKIKEVFAEWAKNSPSPSEKGPGDEGAFLSKLEKNSELKNIVLAETPWVLNARNESESKQRIALLFDMQRMAAERGKALKQLRDAQLGSGAWPWFSGMQPSRWVTQGIVAGFGHLEKLGAADLRPDGQTQQMLKQAVNWLDDDVAKDYQRLLKDYSKKELDQYTPSHSDVQFLYARSFFLRWAITGTTATAANFYKQRLSDTWLQFGLQEQAMIALALHRMGDAATAQLIMKSLGERATRSEELGMYWKNFNAGYSWWDFPTETHALLIEAFHEVVRDEQAVNELRLYLLKLKQTTDWKTTKATAEACYALLLTGDDWLEPAAPPVITVGRDVVVADKQKAGTGYFTKTWSGEEVNRDMGVVTVTTTTDRAAWGALYWQYFEQMDKVTSAASPFSIKKQVLLNTATDAGPQLVALDKSHTLKPGDKLTVRIELRTDRDLDYVHLKDLRASGLEPTETLSGYRFQGGLGYYQSTRDAATDFFFDRIRAGTYVFQYDLRVAQSGDFSNGITTAVCMYAPEFAAHSEGVRIRVGR
nr:alpha-2-macroglobulin family protein [Flavobacteriales bacterium]